MPAVLSEKKIRRRLPTWSAMAWVFSSWAWPAHIANSPSKATILGAPIGAPRQTGELEPLAVTAERIHARQPREEAVFPGRFMLGYLMIVLFFGALIVAFAFVWSQRASDGGGSNWSTFRPTGDSVIAH